MRNLWLVFVTALVAVFSIPACGATFTDDFNAGIRPEFWSVIRNDATGAPWTVQAPDASGALQISKTTDSDAVCWGPFGGVSSRFSMVGDFSVSVDFNLMDFPLTNGGGLNEAFLSVNFPLSDSSFWALHQADQSQGVLGWVSYPTSYHGFGYVPDSTSHGTFELTRSGDTLSAWIDRGSGFVLIGSETSVFLTGPANIGLTVKQWPIDVGPTGRPSTSLDVRFDNLSVVAESIVPEPSTIALLIVGGIGLIVWGWRRLSS
jgi:hypothetical protein